MAMTLEELQVLISAETSGLKKELNNVKKELSGVSGTVKKTTDGMKKAFKGAAVAIVASLATIGLGRFVKNAVASASQLESALLGLQSIVEGQGRSFAKARGFIDEYINDGLVPMSDAVTAYKNLAARGYDDTQIQQVMERLKDAASFGRQASYSLGEAVSTATEGLKNENSVLVDNAGVTKNVAKMWEEYAKSIGKNTQQLTMQEKIQAEVNGIMEETKFQVGDAAKYTDTYAGRMAALSKTLFDVRVNIGQAFMPIANTVLPLLQKLANWLVKITAYAKFFVQAFFGVSSSQKQANVSVGGGAEAQEAYGDAAQKAGDKVKKAAAEAKRSVAGFDEINSLTEPASGGGTGGDSGIDGLGGGADIELPDFDMPEIDTDAIPAKIQEMADKVKGTMRDMWSNLKDLGSSPEGLFGGIIPALRPIVDAVEPIKQSIKDIGTTFLQWKDEVLLPIAGYVITDFVPSIVTGFVKDFAPVFADVAVWSVQLLADTFQNATDMLAELWEGTWLPSLEQIKMAWIGMNSSVSKSLQNLLDGTIKPLVDFILNGFVLPISKKIHEVLVPVLTDVLVWAIKEAAKTFDWAANLMNDIYKSVIEPVFILIRNIVTDTLQIVQNLWDKHGQRLLDNLSDLMDGIRGLFQQLWDVILKPIIEPFLEMLSWLWDKHLKGLIESIGEFIMKLVNGALEIFNKFVMPVVTWLIDILGPAFVRAFNFIIDVLGTSIAFIADIISGLFTILGGLIDFIVGVFTGDWKKAWEGVKSIFKGVFDTLWGIVKFPLNLIIDGINLLISGLNSISFEIPDWVPVIGGKGFGISIPKIPKLARGGIVTAETNFGNYIAGEAGAEMVVPLENTPFVSKLASALGSAVMAAMQMAFAGQDSQQGGDFVFQMDGTTFARIIKPYLKNEDGRIGNIIIQPN